VILCDIVRVLGHKPVARAFVRAGVRPSTYFDAPKVQFFDAVMQRWCCTFGIEGSLFSVLFMCVTRFVLLS
jgi:hypothetical protein